MNEQDFAELAAGFALDTLSPEDTRAFETARRQHPEWEHHVTADAATVALLADGVADVEPPAGVRAALLAQIAESASRCPVAADDARRCAGRRRDVAAGAASCTPGGSPAAADASEPEPQRPRRWGARSWFALAASLAILVGVGWGAVFVGDQLTTPASVVALDEIEASPDAQSETVTLSDGGEATAHWSESVGKAVLVTDGLPTLADDQSYELWFVRDGAPISAGTFTADNGSATALLAGADGARRRDRGHGRGGGRVSHGSADVGSDRHDLDGVTSVAHPRRRGLG